MSFFKTWIWLSLTFPVLSKSMPLAFTQPTPVPQESDARREDGGYSVIGATRSQETALRRVIQSINPEVLPLRVVFVPHWKYLDDARILKLHIPTGYMSQMFTHMPTRTVYIDELRYQGEDWLGYWMAHELGHLATNSVSEEKAEKVARELRKRLKGVVRIYNTSIGRR